MQVTLPSCAKLSCALLDILLSQQPEQYMQSTCAPIYVVAKDNKRSQLLLYSGVLDAAS